MVPPMMKGRPSGKTTIPLQNISHATGCVVTVSLAGSQTPAMKLVFAATLPEPETINTLPLCIIATWTGLMGICVGRVFHWPCTFTWPEAGWVSRVKDKARKSPIATADHRRIRDANNEFIRSPDSTRRIPSSHILRYPNLCAERRPADRLAKSEETIKTKGFTHLPAGVSAFRLPKTQKVQLPKSTTKSGAEMSS